MAAIRRWSLKAAHLATVSCLALSMNAQAQPARPGPPVKQSTLQAGEQVLRPDQPIPARLGDTRQTLTFRIAPEAGSDYTITTRNLAPGVDTVLELLDAAGRVVDQDDDGGDENLASSLDVAGAAEGARVRVRTIGEAGAFEIVLTRDTPRGPPDFPTSLSAARAAPPLAIGATRHLQLRRGEEAYFLLPDDPRELSAFTRNLARNTDTVLALLGASGRVLSEDDDGGEEGLASYLAIPEGAGPRFLRASGLSNARATFDLVLEAEEPAPPPAFATSLVDSVTQPPLAIGQPQRIELRRRQAAYFALPNGEGDLVALTRNLSAQADTLLRLVDGNGREIDRDDDGGDENLASRLELPAGRPRAFLQATNLTNRPGAFDLVLERDTPLPPADFATSLEEARGRPAIALGQAVPLALREGQAAFFALPEEAQELEALTRNLRRGADSVLELLDAQGAVVAQDDDGGDERLSSILTIPPGGRPLFLRATVLSRGSFELLVQAAAPAAPASFPTSIEEAASRPPIEIGQPQRIELRRRQSAFFRLPPEAAGLVALTRNLAEETDTVLSLLDASGNVISEDDDGGEGPLASRLALAGPGKGGAYLRVSSLGNRTARFELVVERP